MWSVRKDAEKAGLSKIGISLAMRRLALKQFVADAWVEDHGGDGYKGAAITAKGWDWIDANEDRFTLRRQQKVTVPDYSEAITDEDIPF